MKSQKKLVTEEASHKTIQLLHLPASEAEEDSGDGAEVDILS